jgi:hypothetical protein
VLKYLKTSFEKIDFWVAVRVMAILAEQVDFCRLF